MKTQIKRMSPHQNGKVFGVLMAATSLVFLIPMLLVMVAAMREMDQEMGFFSAGPAVIFVVFPVLYLVFGYVFIAIGCMVYNTIAKFVGGIEFDLERHEG